MGLLLPALLLGLACGCTGGPISRIVGGQPATPGQFPWQVSLQLRQLFVIWSHICGAVLYEDGSGGPYDKILTAAHCVDGQTVSNLRVIVGEHDTSSTSNGNEQIITVASVRKHENYDGNGNGYPNDIAILTLSRAVTLNEFVQPIPIAESGADFTGTTCTISGWGRTSGGSTSLPSILQWVDMTSISNTQCRDAWTSVSGAEITDSHVCVFQSGKSACNGDSGGPMVCGGRLAGVTSWGISSCDGSYPSVYTRVSYYRSWMGLAN